ncbi:MAG: aminodeoxychorismate synthase component I, partial [Flavobacteriaceae bacterium]|nr:aminodeoxychorismate synthase component I [Flavobacteriaceae bacterium]
MRTSEVFDIHNIKDKKARLLQWSKSFDHIAWLDSNDYPSNYGEYEAILAVGCNRTLKSNYLGAFDSLKSFIDDLHDWVFGYLTYDLKNDIENLESNNVDGLGFSELYFFQPIKIILIKENKIEFKYLDEVKAEIHTDFEEISTLETATQTSEYGTDAVNSKMRIFKDEYFNKVEKVLDHIHRGDIYEANFSQEFYLENTSIDPFLTYQRLNSIS